MLPILIASHAATTAIFSGGCSAALPPDLAPGNSTIRHFDLIDTDARLGAYNRPYKISLPSTYDGTKPLPVLFYFHGQCGSIQHEDDKFVELGEKRGFIVVSPRGMEDGGTLYGACTGWNMGSGGRLDVCTQQCTPEIHKSCLLTAAMSNCNWSTCHDDVDFVKQLLATLKAELCLDVSRFYVTGASNGAMFTYRLLAELPPQTFAAAAPWYGLVLRNMWNPPTAEHATALLHLHGLKDKTIPPVGDYASHYYYHPLNDTLRSYGVAASCAVARGWENTSTPWDKPATQTHVNAHTCVTYDGCERGGGGRGVTRCFFPNAAHGFWPPFAEKLTWWWFVNRTNDVGSTQKQL